MYDRYERLRHKMENFSRRQLYDIDENLRIIGHVVSLPVILRKSLGKEGKSSGSANLYSYERNPIRNKPYPQ